MASLNKIESKSNGPLTRILDGIDRGHARSADRLHTLRNGLRDRIEHVLDRVEVLAHSAITAARAKVKVADSATADSIIRAQGAVGRAIEKARHARSEPAHLAS